MVKPIASVEGSAFCVFTTTLEEGFCCLGAGVVETLSKDDGVVVVFCCFWPKVSLRTVTTSAFAEVCSTPILGLAAAVENFLVELVTGPLEALLATNVKGAVIELVVVVSMVVTVSRSPIVLVPLSSLLCLATVLFVVMLLLSDG